MWQLPMKQEREKPRDDDWREKCTLKWIILGEIYCTPENGTDVKRDSQVHP